MGQFLSPSDMEAPDEARIRCTNRCTDSTQDCRSVVPKRSAPRELPERCVHTGSSVPDWWTETGWNPEKPRDPIAFSTKFWERLFGKSLNSFWTYSIRMWKKDISWNNPEINFRNYFSYRRVMTRMSRHHLLGYRYACSNPQASGMRGWFSTVCRAN